MGVLVEMIDEVVAGPEEDRLQTLFEHAPGFVAVVKGPNHVFSLANAAYRRLVDERPLLGRAFREALPELEGQGFLRILDRVYSTGRPFMTTGMVVSLQPSSSEPRRQRRLNFIAQPLVTATGHVEGIFCEGHDATEHWLADETLREKETALSLALQENGDILDNSLDVICTVDAEGRFLAVSQRCEELWGYSPQELVGRAYIDFVHPDDREATNKIAAAIVGGTPTKSFQNRYLRKDGSVVPVLWSSVWSEEHQRLFATAKDMTERLHVEEQLRQSQRMEAVGKLTGGVAHDFNNLLAVVIGNAESMLETLAKDAPERELADLTLQAGERGAALVRRLLTFARQRPLAPELVDISAMVASMKPLITRAVGAAIDVRIVTGDGAITCLADHVQLESALLNLCVNARDAMPTGGALVIETGWLTADHPYDVDDKDIRPGECVFVSVTDNGEGMSPEAIDRAFEPFFTTKETAKGSGLGLSTVYGFVKQSGGHTRITSELGRGTVVTMFLPCTVSTTLKGALAGPTPPVASPLVAHILLVEDDEMVRNQVKRLLLSLSHQVTVCENSAEALVILQSDPTITLLLTDIVLPGSMNGRELADQACILQPELPVLFTSGYTEDDVIMQGRETGELHFLAKPYRKAELARKVEDALQPRTSPADG